MPPTTIFARISIPAFVLATVPTGIANAQPSVLGSVLSARTEAVVNLDGAAPESQLHVVGSRFGFDLNEVAQQTGDRLFIQSSVNAGSSFFQAGSSRWTALILPQSFARYCGCPGPGIAADPENRYEFDGSAFHLFKLDDFYTLRVSEIQRIGTGGGCTGTIPSFYQEYLSYFEISRGGGGMVHQTFTSLGLNQSFDRTVVVSSEGSGVIVPPGIYVTRCFSSARATTSSAGSHWCPSGGAGLSYRLDSVSGRVGLLCNEDWCLDPDGDGAITQADLTAFAAAPIDVNRDGLIDQDPLGIDARYLSSSVLAVDGSLVDLDGNGFPDSYDIEVGAVDANSNGVPDDVESKFDRNEDGFADFFDVANYVEIIAEGEPDIHPTVEIDGYEGISKNDLDVFLKAIDAIDLVHP